jgi:hypothetical protein
MFSSSVQGEKHYNEKSKIYDTRFNIACNRNDHHLAGITISAAVMDAGGKGGLGIDMS